jgi:basic membrane protein A
MNKRIFHVFLVTFICAMLLLSACAPVEKPAIATAAPTQAAINTSPSCLTIGALYGGSINDVGYNQAMHDAVMKIKTNIDCVKIIEVDNLADEATATTTMEDMIQKGAKLIIATSFNFQYAALELSKKYPDVKFEHAGGWEMGPNFANFYGNPVDGWYLMGVAAGKMTKSNKLGFVASFPLGWTSTFINAFELGAKSVNPDAQTIVTYTFAWGDSAKEAETANSLIDQGVDVITMHVDSPSKVISTAESRGVYSIGYQNLAVQQFAPKFWISGTGFTLGDKLTWLASTVLDGTWKPIFLRCGIPDGCMAIAPFGPKVPQEVQDLVMQTKADIESGKIVVFKGPIVDQDGNVKVAEGEVLSPDAMGSVDWFVKGVVGNPK